MRFEKLELSGWRQFEKIDLSLHPRLTVLTGANGAGKSTILRLFSNQSGENYNFLATPTRTKQGGLQYAASLARRLKAFFRNDPNQGNIVGETVFSDGTKNSLVIPRGIHAEYNIQIMPVNARSPRTIAPGIHFDSHRPIPMYQMVNNIPKSILTAERAFNDYIQIVRSARRGQHVSQNPMHKMKEALISMALFGEGNSSVRGNEQAFDAFRGFQSALRHILPDSLGFRKIDVRTPDIVLITETGDFLIDAASGGIHALIDLTWRIYTFSLFHESFTVTFDEPENHLHPSLQRTLMNDLLTAFPQAQFIIATHSPFMVSSVKDSSVYVLRYKSSPNARDELERDIPIERKISSELLDTVNKAGTAGEILRDVLGVETTMPEWVADDLDRIMAEYRNREITDGLLLDLRGQLRSLGMEEFYPQSLAQLSRSR